LAVATISAAWKKFSPMSYRAMPMSDTAIRVEGLSKQYRLGARRQPYHTLSETLTTAVTSLWRRAGQGWQGRARGSAVQAETIWALKDVSFQVKRGEVVGIVGRNGSGKSTLLKLLSRITHPTEGYAEIRGRVGSLLEVGTGFHPELTGRENIYLNGAILGMRRAEIERQFDAILAFAEVDKFIDTPVKRYSSGMRMRLAFAVAAHLEPEILLIDEVLAVGDAAFQKKCLQKMEDVGHQGRTVLFVSHNMPAVTRLCPRAILLEEGRVRQDGPAYQVAGGYLASGLGTTAIREWPNPETAPGREVVRLRAVRVRTQDGGIADAVDIRQPVAVEMEYEVLKSGYRLMPNFQFYTEEGIHAFSAHDLDPVWRQRSRPAGCFVSTVWIPGNFLAEGTLFVAAGCETVDPRIFQFWEADAVAFQVIDNLDGDSARGDYGGHIAGVVRPLLRWSTRCSLDGDDTSAGLADKAEAQ
jgi:lipopolysaccharide transport system ATP-binding protein